MTTMDRVVEAAFLNEWKQVGEADWGNTLLQAWRRAPEGMVVMFSESGSLTDVSYYRNGHWTTIDGPMQLARVLHLIAGGA